MYGRCPMINETTIVEFIWIIILTIYTVSITFLTKKTYDLMVKKGIKKKDAVYYNRKIVHIFAGGVIALIVPIVFSSSIYPLFCGLSITIITYLSHKRRRGKMLYWFQTEDNLNDVSFCFMWGITIFVLWEVMGAMGNTGAPWIAIIPAVFVSFGDGVTGIARNALFKKRTKHPIGNVFMAAVCIPLGYFLAGFGGIAIGGAIAAIVASTMERYEFGPIDDNILITISSSIVLYIFIL